MDAPIISKTFQTINSYRELRVFQKSMNAAVEIFTMTKAFPREERYSLIDQIRRSSRSVCANLAEAWRKRRYKAAFIAKLSDAEGEACETQVWLEFSYRFGYLQEPEMETMSVKYDEILGQLVQMINKADSFVIQKP